MSKPNHSLEKKFFLKDDVDLNELIKDINTKLPIGVSGINHIIKRVHDQYPFLTEGEIRLIAKEIFITFRELVISGYTINIGLFFNGMRLAFAKPARKAFFAKVLAVLPKKVLRENIEKYRGK